MDQPLHDLRPFQPGRASSHRFISIGLVALFHVIAIYALATGLVQNLVSKLPQELKVAVVQTKEQNKPPPPPPPPELQKPPPPFVPPPEINIQTESSAPTITTQSKVATPPPPPHVEAPPKPAGITAPASIGAPHTCPSARWYPPIAVRLNQQGTTAIKFTINIDGSVANVQIANSSGYDSLDQAAIRCSSTWHYKPAMQNGQPIAVTWQTNVKWDLTGQ